MAKAEPQSELLPPANSPAHNGALSGTLRAATSLLHEPGAKRRRPSRATRAWLIAGALAAAAAIGVALTPFSLLFPQTQTYATSKSQHRTLTLANGSTVDLKGGSSLQVSMGLLERRVVMGPGEAVFDIAQNATHPFVVAAGDCNVRAVAARFEVRRRDGWLSVTVERGAVEVEPVDRVSGRRLRLHPGQRLDHLEGAP